jgi:hypothetical protein
MNTHPQHIAVIMDGNGRWAKKRLMPRTVGHARGVANVRHIVKAAHAMGLRYLTLFAFSSENWRRPPDEVSALMGLFLQYLESEVAEMKAAGIRLRVIGDRSAFAPLLQSRIDQASFEDQHQRVIALDPRILGHRYGMGGEQRLAAPGGQPQANIGRVGQPADVRIAALGGTAIPAAVAEIGARGAARSGSRGREPLRAPRHACAAGGRRR